ncbi:MAG: type II toxin-antitoxin system Phd/YefM family antitoxin [Verrucomicrobiaceae bacterium]|nr:MAG: type II toxin-antitoxin system Phd/YefM family antitoxin [Verrucomicrobiaceae bacterium]
MAKPAIMVPMAITHENQAFATLMEEIGSLPSITASALKNNFGHASRQAAKGALAITRRQRTEFVLLPVAQYAELQRARQAPLDALSAQFDAMVGKMDTSAARQGTAKLFQAGWKELGQAAVKAAKSHAR